MGFNGEEYSLLKDLNLEFKGEEHRAFSLCFWLYLTNSSSSPSTILRQVNSDVKFNAPFLVLNERKKMMLFPLIFLHQEAPNPVLSAPWSEAPYALSNVEFPLDKWVHVGCEVSADFVRLHIDEEIVAEKPLTSLLNVNANSDGLRTVSLVGTDGDSGEIKGYVHGVDVLPLTSSIKNHHVKDPPLKLSIDSSSTSEIEEDSDGVLCIVGGKASCRRNFSLDVILSDAFDQPVNKELEVVASLIYADNEAPVEKPNDAEAPLLTSYDGIEFASSDRPSKLMNGRASFRLKISQLSSKCDNRLFRIKFDIPKMGRHPFLEAISLPIRCISRNRTSKTSFPMFKRSSSLINLPNGSQSSGFDDGSSELLQNIVHEARPSPLSKRVKLGQEKTFMDLKSDFMRERADEECNSHAWTANEVEIKRNSQDDKSNGKSFDGRSGGHKEIVDYSDSDSSEATNSDSKSVPSNKTLISDLVVFKYCLGSLTERSLLLKDIATSSSEEELFDFAEQVSLYSGCSHHRQQIRIAKRLVEEGIKAWKMISQNNYHVLWERLVPEIKEHFLKIACCNSRSLTHQQPGSSGALNSNPHIPPPPPLQPQAPPTGQAHGGGGSGSIRPGSMADRARMANIPMPEPAQKCPRCESTNTKFCYFNNYSLSQPRHFCKTCRRYWTRGGALRSVPVGGGCRRNKRTKSSSSSKSPATSDRQTTSAGPTSSGTSSAGGTANMLNLTPRIINTPAPARFMTPLMTQFADYGLNFSGNDTTNEMNNYQMGTNNFLSGTSGGVGASVFPSAGGFEPWRFPQAHQFPLFGGGLDPSSSFPFHSEADHQPRLTAPMLSQLASVKLEDNNQESNLLRQFMGIQGNNDQWSSGGGSAWTDLSGFSSSSPSNPL